MRKLTFMCYRMCSVMFVRYGQVHTKLPQHIELYLHNEMDFQRPGWHWDFGNL